MVTATYPCSLGPSSPRPPSRSWAAWEARTARWTSTYDGPMSVVDWVKLELDLGNVRHDRPLLLPDDISITTLAVLGDTSANRHQIYRLNKACSADIPGRGSSSPTRSTPSAVSRASAFVLTGKCCCSTRTPWWASAH